jgi:hypothetical protein
MKFSVQNAEPAKDILYLLDDYTAIAVNVSDEGVTAGTDGKKIVPAGTVIGGVLEDPTQAAVAAEGGSGEGAVAAEGVLMHDVDVTDGEALGTMIIRGVLDGTKLPANITAAQKATMPMITVVGTVE